MESQKDEQLPKTPGVAPPPAANPPATSPQSSMTEAWQPPTLEEVRAMLRRPMAPEDMEPLRFPPEIVEARKKQLQAERRQYDPSSPRENLAGTHADGGISPQYWDSYQDGLNGGQHGAVRAGDILTGDAAARMARAVSQTTLDSPVRMEPLEGDFANAAAVMRPDAGSPSGYQIVLNQGLKLDPDELFHAIAHELIHIERGGKGRAFVYEQEVPKTPLLH